MEADLERSNFAGSVFVRRLQNYKGRVETRESWRKHHKTVSTQVYHDRWRRNLGQEPADWRTALMMMAELTPEQSPEWIEDGLKIDVSAGARAAILDNAGDDKISAIRRRTGVVIKVAQDGSTLLLSGTPQAINRATEEVTRIAGVITATRLSASLGPGEERTEQLGEGAQFFEPPLSREEGASFARRRIKEHIYKIPMPLTWTPKTLEDYVAKLVDSVVPRHLHSELYAPVKGEVLVDHERAIVRHTLSAFHSNAAKKAASCSALKVALSFMAAKGIKYLFDALRLFVVIDRLGIEMDVDIFNILVMPAVRSRNLREFVLTLENMERRGVSPNVDTWLLFLRMFESPEVRSYVLQAMSTKNLLVIPDVIRRVAREMASMDAEYAVNRGKSLTTFLAEQEERYGSEWLTLDSGNRVLDVLAGHGRFQDAFELLDLMVGRHDQNPDLQRDSRAAVKPDAVSLTTIVSHAKNQDKITVAVNLVRKTMTKGLLRQPSGDMLHLLFEMAWKRRLRTAIVVIWRYACLARLTSWRMRLRVSMLLSGKVSEKRYELTEPVYRSLGGESLARELAGGPAALALIRDIMQKLWGSDPYFRGEAGVFAAKALALAFEGFGPAVKLGTVLAQAMLLDFRCLRAKKSGQLRQVLQDAKGKSLPLWRRKPQEEFWVDVGPPLPIPCSKIGPNDVWEDLYDKWGWQVRPKKWIAEAGGARYDPSTGRTIQPAVPDAANREAEENLDSLSATDIESLPQHGSQQGSVSNETASIHNSESCIDGLQMEKQMAIINPGLWVDDLHGDRVAVIEAQSMPALRKQNEKAILGALDSLGRQKNTSRQRHVSVTEGGSEDTDIEMVEEALAGSYSEMDSSPEDAARDTLADRADGPAHTQDNW